MPDFRTSLAGMRRVLTSGQLMMAVAAALVGVGAGLGAVLFRLMIFWAEELFWPGHAGELELEFVRDLPWYMKLVTPAVGSLLLAPIVLRFATETRGSGVAEVVEAVALHGGHIRKRVAPLKALASALCLGSGGSVGREAPIIQIGAGIGSTLGQWLRVPVGDLRTLAGCGAAGGLAATFNTPFAACFFVVEAIMGDVGVAKISPLVISSVIATVVARHYTTEFPQIDLPPFQEELTLLKILPYLLVGVACALVGAAFLRSMESGVQFFRRLKVPVYLKPAVGGLLVGSVGVFVPHILGVGYETTNLVLAEKLGFAALLGILAAKIFATVACIAAGNSGGIFGPSLFLGALTGSLVGLATRWAAPDLVDSTAAFAMVGMGAMIAAIHHAPIASVLLIFEMTHDPDTILPLMAGCIPAVVFCAWIRHESIDGLVLRLRGVKIRQKGEVDVLKGLRVSGHFRKRIHRVKPGASLSDLVDRFLDTPYPIMWMTDAKGRLLGRIESDDLKVVMLERESLMTLIVAQDIATAAEARLHPDEDLSLAMKLFSESNQDVLPVTDRETGVILGDLTRGDVIEAYNRELAVRDSVGRTLDAISLTDRAGRVEIGDGYSVQEVEAPARLLGQTLRDLDLRNRAGLQAILLKRSGKTIVPGPDTRLQARDVLVLAGRAQDLEEGLRKL